METRKGNEGQEKSKMKGKERKEQGRERKEDGSQKKMNEKVTELKKGRGKEDKEYMDQYYLKTLLVPLTISHP